MSRIQSGKAFWQEARSVAPRQLDFLEALDGPVVPSAGSSAGAPRTDRAARPARPPQAARARRGARSYHAGLAAEESVARHYHRRGAVLRDRRWRGGGAEIDLVIEEEGVLVFVEVKASRSHEEALIHVTPRQIQRIMAAAGGYLRGMPEGQLTELRFDVATVDGQGDLRILEGAFGH